MHKVRRTQRYWGNEEGDRLRTEETWELLPEKGLSPIVLFSAASAFAGVTAPAGHAWVRTAFDNPPDGYAEAL